MSNQQDVREQNFLKNLRIVLNLESGHQVFKYLLEEFDVLGCPPPLMKPEQLAEETAYRRFGGALVNYLSKADPVAYGRIMIELAKEKHSEFWNEDQVEDESE